MTLQRLLCQAAPVRLTDVLREVCARHERLAHLNYQSDSSLCHKRIEGVMDIRWTSRYTQHAFWSI